MADDMQSPLLRLPPELRNRIYILVLHDNIKVSVRFQRSIHFTGVPGITLASRQIQNESASIYYNNATFTGFDGTEICDWLCSIPREHAALVRNIHYFDGIRYLTHADPARAEAAQEDLRWIETKMQLAGMTLSLEGVVKTRVRIPGAEWVWTSTPVETFAELIEVRSPLSLTKSSVNFSIGENGIHPSV